MPSNPSSPKPGWHSPSHVTSNKMSRRQKQRGGHSSSSSGKAVDLGSATSVLDQQVMADLIQHLDRVPSDLGEDAEAVPVPLESIVKIEVVATAPNYHVPWQTLPQESYSGSGFVVGPKRILTNAHVVENNSLVRVRRHNSADTFIAKVLAFAQACDLALLTVEEDAFWDGIQVLKLASLPRLYEDIMVVGYPIGGDNVSLTRGIVSRIDMLPYVTRSVDNSTELLVVQIDAAINPGNSGGPACNMDGDVVGVAFAGLNAAQSIGYVIPTTVIRSFMRQIELPPPPAAEEAAASTWAAMFAPQRLFRGICELGLDYQSMTNPALRKRFQLAEGQSGVLLGDVAPLSCAALKAVRVAAPPASTTATATTTDTTPSSGEKNGKKHKRHSANITPAAAPATTSSATPPAALATEQPPSTQTPVEGAVREDGKDKKEKGPIAKGDVLLAVNGTTVANDGTVLFVDGKTRMRLGLESLISSHIPGEHIVLTLLRDGIRYHVDVELNTLPRLVPSFHGLDAYPSYFVVGGMVFTLLSIPLMNQVLEGGIAEDIGSTMIALQQALRTRKKSEDQEYVVLLRILIAEVNYGYSVDPMTKLLKVNNVPINNMRQLITEVTAAKGEFLELEFEDDELVVLSNEQVKASEAAILKQHHIPSCVSDDLLAFYERQTAKQ